MNGHFRAVVVLILATLTGGCGAASDGMESHQQILAQVDGLTLTVDRAAEQLARVDASTAPARMEVVDAFVDLWVASVLLVQAYAQPDSFETVDVDPLLESTPVNDLSREQAIVNLLKRDVVDARANVTDPELREAYESEQPWKVASGRYIQIRVPSDASSEARDSLAALARDLRRRAVAGADFAELAREYSDDPATAADGGTVTGIQRGRLLPALDSALFALEPGEISDVLEAGIGYHLFKLREIGAPPFDQVREQYRLRYVQNRTRELEQAYIDSLMRVAQPRIPPGAPTLARRLASAPELERLSPARRKATLAEYRGGRLTVGQYADFLIKGWPSSMNAFARSDTATVKQYLNELVRSRLLVDAARDEGYRLPPEQVDSMRAQARQGLRLAASALRLRRQPVDGSEAAILASVEDAMHRILTGQAPPRPLIRMLPALRSEHEIRVHAARFGQVLERLEALRSTGAVGGRRHEPAPAN